MVSEGTADVLRTALTLDGMRGYLGEMLSLTNWRIGSQPASCM